MLSQAPSVPAPFFAAEHAEQVDEQAASQQTPSTQKSLWHWFVPPHAEPIPSLATHVVPLQKLPGEQSISAAQLALHDVAPHVYRPHGVVPVSRQVPLPSHMSAFVWVPAAQDKTSPQAVPELELPHEPLPSHMPVMHVAVEHWFCGSVPLTMLPQTPSLPIPFNAAVQA